MLTDNPGAPLILVVEDDDNHAELIRISIREAAEEYRLEIVGTLNDARTVISGQRPDIVLSDYRLPDGDGSELVASVDGFCPVILLTSQGSEQVAVAAMKSGVHDYLVKTLEVFSGLSHLVQHSLQEWALIQQQKRAEEEQQRVERHFLHAQKLESLGTMSGGIAHDFNNLLQSVLGNLELALMKIPADAAVRTFVCNAVNAAEQAAKLSGMMLAYTGKGLFKVKEVDLTELVEENAALLASGVSKSISFYLKLDSSLPLIMADGEQILQVIINMIINASESIGDLNGSITLSISFQTFNQKTLDSSRIEEKLPEGRYVLIEVTDSGCGMSPETLDKIFDPFYTTKFTGRGLGMSAVHGIIRAHNGAIMLESSLGSGSSIRVLLPVADDYQMIEMGGSSVPAAASRDVSCCRKVLIVDDEKMIRNLLIEIVGVLGFEPVAAECGEEAVRIFLEEGDRFRLVLLDQSMPGMDGVAVFTELRKIRSDIPVLLASGFSKEVILERFKGLDLNGFIQKPFKLNSLMEEMKRALNE